MPLAAAGMHLAAMQVIYGLLVKVGEARLSPSVVRLNKAHCTGEQ